MQTWARHGKVEVHAFVTGRMAAVEIEGVDERASTGPVVIAMALWGGRTMGASRLMVLIRQHRLCRHQAGLDSHVEPHRTQQCQEACRKSATGKSQPGQDTLPVSVQCDHRQQANRKMPRMTISWITKPGPEFGGGKP